MRCEVAKCTHNEDRYCIDDSYVEIDENGECNLMFAPCEEESDDED